MQLRSVSRSVSICQHGMHLIRVLLLGMAFYAIERRVTPGWQLYDPSWRNLQTFGAEISPALETPFQKPLDPITHPPNILRNQVIKNNGMSFISSRNFLAALLYRSSMKSMASWTPTPFSFMTTVTMLSRWSSMTRTRDLSKWYK